MPLKVSATEFQQSFGLLSDRARSEPVVITKHGQDSLVVMSAHEWKRLKRRDRNVGATADLPDEWMTELETMSLPDDAAEGHEAAAHT